MSYAIQTTVSGDFKSVCELTRQALAGQGFGILNEIDLQATMKKKIDQDIPAYLILGACHPASAYASLQAEPRVGLMLPCNVILRQLEGDQVEVAAIDPAAMMAPIGNPELTPIAKDIRERLQRAIDALNAA